MPQDQEHAPCLSRACLLIGDGNIHGNRAQPIMCTIIGMRSALRIECERKHRRFLQVMQATAASFRPYSSLLLD